MMASVRCQCRIDAANHKAGECQNSSQYSVVEDGQTMFVCGDCRLSRHTDVKEIGVERCPTCGQIIGGE
jgi:hypothetical protein